MSYADDFLVNRYAMTAIAIGHQYRKSPSWMWSTARALRDADIARAKGPMSDDHLKQVAVKLARTAA